MYVDITGRFHCTHFFYLALVKESRYITLTGPSLLFFETGFIEEWTDLAFFKRFIPDPVGQIDTARSLGASKNTA